MAEVSSVSTREVRGQLRRKSERERGCFPHAVLEAWQRNRRSELGSALWGRAPSSRGKRHRSPGFSCPPPPTSPPSCSPGKGWLARAGGPGLTSLTPSRVLCTVKSIHLQPVMI